MQYTIEPPRRPSVYLEEGPSRRRSGLRRIVLYGIAAVMVFSAAYLEMRLKKMKVWSMQAASPVPPPVSGRTLEIGPKVAMNGELVHATCSRDSLLMSCNFTIRNEMDIPLKDFVIECKGYAASDTAIDMNRRTIYDIVKPHSVKTFHGFSMGFVDPQVKTYSCRLK